MYKSIFFSVFGFVSMQDEVTSGLRLSENVFPARYIRQYPIKLPRSSCKIIYYYKDIKENERHMKL